MSQYYEVKRDPFLVSTDPSLLDIDVIHHYLSTGSYWAINIPRETVERSLQNSICFGVYHLQQQIGLSRVITDKATFAYLADVFILPEYRGKGLSKWMMEVIHAHPELQGLRRWMLGTKDAHGLYEQYGWTALDDEAKRRFMQKVKKNAYQ
jgi:GNAT superfamily N-acetyltransferase